MMKKLLILFTAAVAACGSLFAGNWVFDPVAQTVSDDVWTFKASVAKNSTNLTINKFQVVPDVVSELDFSKPVELKDDPQTTYTIVELNPQFGHCDGETGWQPKGYPEGAFVGRMTLPLDGLKKISGSSFAACKNMVCQPVFPPTFETLGEFVFAESSVSGDVVFPASVKSLSKGVFRNSQITSLTFDGCTASIGGEYGKGFAEGCTALKKVRVKANSSVTMTVGQQFLNCSALEVADLRGVISMQFGTDGKYRPFNGCSSLRVLAFGDRLEFLDKHPLDGATKLAEIHFYGALADSVPRATDLGLAASATTFVHLDPDAADYETAKASWDEMTEGGEINATDSVWKEELGARRALVLYTERHVKVEKTVDADKEKGIVGSFVISRGENDSDTLLMVVGCIIGGTAKPGTTYSALDKWVTIPAGKRSVTVSVLPLDDPEALDDSSLILTLQGELFYAIDGEPSVMMTVGGGETWHGWKFVQTSSDYKGLHGYVTNGCWSFTADVPEGASGRKLQIGAVQAYPAEVTPLDFSGIYASLSGVGYILTVLNPNIGGNGKARAVVGELTLPGEGLLSLGNSAFSNCSNATGRIVLPSTLTSLGEASFYRSAGLVFPGDGLPSSIKTIPGSCFSDGIQIDGELDLTHVVTINSSAFKNCKTLKSVKFGPDLKTIGGGYDVGSFMGCTALTNIALDVRAQGVDLEGVAFNGCSSLVEVNLAGVSRVKVGDDDSNPKYTSQPPFMNCTSLKKITFATNLTYLAMTAFKGIGKLETVVFEGLPPTTFKMPFLYGASNSKVITTYVRERNIRTMNEVGTNWVMLAANNVINRKTSTWDKAFIPSDTAVAKRPLLAIPDPGLMLIVK